MAEELRWETLISSSITTTNAVGEFRNDTSGDIFIRSIDFFLHGGKDGVGTDADINGEAQLSKSNTVDIVNNTSIWQLNAGVAVIHDDTAGVGNGADNMTVNKLYAKGQLILEPGESIFLHIVVTALTNFEVFATLGYHF